MLLGAVALALPSMASAATPVSQAFTTVGEHEFVVPAGVTSAQVTLVGGSGGEGDASFSSEVSQGGLGATFTATLAVTPGETLFVEIAGNGQLGGAGGYGGGGASQGGETMPGGGGGASDVRTCSTELTNPANPAGCAALGSLASRLVVAAGGGGGGAEGADGSGDPGGEGGGAGGPGAKGTEDNGQAGGDGGQTGGQGAGGKGGGHSGSGAAGDGLLGSGGSGAPGFSFVGGGGGGGGGGIYGGGGGGGGEVTLTGMFYSVGAGGGGGGGSSGVPTGVTRVSDSGLGQTGAGTQASVTFSWGLPGPAAVTGTAPVVTSTSATLAGTVNPDGSSVSDCHFAISPASPSGAMVPCSQQVGSGSTPVAVSASLTGLAPSTTYTVTLTASSAQGSSSGSPVTFTTSASSGAGSDTRPPGTGPLRTALTVTNLKLSPARLRRGTRAATIAKAKPKKQAKALPTSTTISFALSAAATTKLSFELAQPGVLGGRKCSAASKTHRKGKRCTRYTTVRGGVTRSGHAGTDRITFAGILDGGARLSPGEYRLSLSAGSPSGNATAAQHPVFTLLR
jgi:hypothetical protein